MIEHGTRSRYTKKKCRCGPCTFANTQYQREYRRTDDADPVAAAFERGRESGFEAGYNAGLRDAGADTDLPHDHTYGGLLP